MSCEAEDFITFVQCVHSRSFCSNCKSCLYDTTYFSLINESFVRHCDQDYFCQDCIQRCRKSLSRFSDCNPLNKIMKSPTRNTTKRQLYSQNNNYLISLICDNGQISMQWAHLALENTKTSVNLSHCSSNVLNHMVPHCNGLAHCTYDFTQDLQSLKSSSNFCNWDDSNAELSFEVGALCMDRGTDSHKHIECVSDERLLLNLIFSICITFVGCCLLNLIIYGGYLKCCKATWKRSGAINRPLSPRKMMPLVRVPSEVLDKTVRGVNSNMPRASTHSVLQTETERVNGMPLYSQNNKNNNNNSKNNNNNQSSPKMSNSTNKQTAMHILYSLPDDDPRAEALVNPHAANGRTTNKKTNEPYVDLNANSQGTQNRGHSTSTQNKNDDLKNYNNDMVTDPKRIQMANALMNPHSTQSQSSSSSQSASRSLAMNLEDWHDMIEIKCNELQFNVEIGPGRSVGKVFKARWCGLEVACKKFKNEDVDPNRFMQFIKEMKVFYKHVKHPNLIQYYSYSQRPFCLVMEYVDGTSAQEYLRHDRPESTQLSILDRVLIAKQAAEGINHLHNKGLLHGNIAARNLLIKDRRNQPKKELKVLVSDYGTSRILYEDVYSATYTSVGPLKWMAPEALSDNKYTSKSDVYSFGITLWELLTGSEPYADVDPMNTALEVLVSAKRPKLYDTIPTKLQKLMKRCWDSDASKRPEFSEIIAMLSKFIAHWQKEHKKSSIIDDDF